MSRVVIKWYGPKLDRAIRKGMASNTAAAASTYRDLIRDAISVQGPPRSGPYRVPHREFGELIRAFSWEVDRKALSARVGTGLIKTYNNRLVPYGRYLEYGTSRMRSRPHIRRVLYDRADVIGRVWAKPL